ncbi:MAG TPA: PAS domain S-box protein [Chthonomonadaceae bacterium]|nr:PAS domain S-box protein [Chthonomonadaceae bacterium]
MSSTFDKHHILNPGQRADVSQEELQSVQESEERLRLALEQQTAYRQAMENAILAGIAVVDLQGRQTYVNPALAQVLGWSPDELVGCLPPFPYWPPEEIPAITEAFQTTLRGAAPPGGFELRFQRRDGERFDVLVSICPLKDSQEQVTGWLAAVLDITERKRAERALRESEERYRRIVETVQEGIWMQDVDGKTIYVNSKMAEMLGYTVEEMLGRPVSAFLDAQGQAELQKKIENRRQGVQEQYDARYKRKDGSDLWVIISTTPLTDDTGAYAGALAAMIDITERKRMEEALQDAETQTRRILESISDAFISLDLDWRLVYINENAARLAHKNRAELLGQCIWDVFPGLVNSRFHAECLRAIREQTPIRYEDYYSQVRIWFDLHLYPTENGLSVFCRDISEQRRSRLEIESLNARLRRAMAETHHRVKNNLQVISSLVDLQVMENVDHVPIGELQRLSQHTSALAVIHDLLTDAARASGEVDILHTQTILEKLYPLLQHLAHGRALHFQAEDAGLSARQGTGLAVVVNELVSNAVKHGRGDITVALRVKNSEIRLEVWDEGPGFPEGFDAVQAAHTGLDLVDQVCRWDLGGKVAYARGPKGGASVVVTFPLTPK